MSFLLREKLTFCNVSQLFIKCFFLLKKKYKNPCFCWKNKLVMSLNNFIGNSVICVLRLEFFLSLEWSTNYVYLAMRNPINTETCYCRDNHESHHRPILRCHKRWNVNVTITWKSHHKIDFIFTTFLSKYMATS